MVSIAPNLSYLMDDDGIAILNVGRNTITTLNEVGSYVWKRLEVGLQIDSIVAELARDTGAEPTQIAQDVDAFIEELRLERLIISAPTGNHPGVQT